MSELRSAIECFRSESVAELPDARVEEDFLELQSALETLEAERLRRLAEIERRGLFASDGGSPVFRRADGSIIGEVGIPAEDRAPP